MTEISRLAVHLSISYAALCNLQHAYVCWFFKRGVGEKWKWGCSSP